MMKHSLFFSALILFFLLLWQCKPDKGSFEKALSSVSTEDITAYVKRLGSDEFLGRKPFTPGEERALEYLEGQFRRIGLQPANAGSFYQDVPLVEVDSRPVGALEQYKSGLADSFSFPDEFVATSRRLEGQPAVEKSPLVFAGYGIVAPEYGWNDYKGIDVEGKTVIVLVNDPGFATGDTALFKGREMTYYGRWTYKYEEAARQGAAAVLVVHQTGPAGYPWEVVRNGALVPELYLQAEDGYASRCAIEGWLTYPAAQRMFANAGISPDIMKNAAQPDFKAMGMQSAVGLRLASSHREHVSRNIMGYIHGRERPEEVVIYSAHWDHFGVGRPLNGDSVYNGAVDNGTSLAWMLEIAEAFMALPRRPERSVMFFAPTAEETGLLGSAYYVSDPVFALEKTVANINNDLMLPYGRMKDVMITGYGQSELDEYVAQAAQKQGRYVLPDPNPHRGMYFRSDHFSFAKKGVPSLFARGNCDHHEHGREWMAQKEREWLEKYYHKPTDEYEHWWDLTGVADDARLLFRVGYKLANEKRFPQWKDGSEFKGVLKRE